MTNDLKLRPCPLEKYLSVMSGAWMSRIMWNLLYVNRPMRFGELQRAIDGISAKVLTNSLRILERERIVKRNVLPMSPPQVEYELTDRGREFEPIFRAMEEAARRLFPPQEDG